MPSAARGELAEDMWNALPAPDLSATQLTRGLVAGGSCWFEGSATIGGVGRGGECMVEPGGASGTAV